MWSRKNVDMNLPVFIYQIDEISKAKVADRCYGLSWKMDDTIDL